MPANPELKFTVRVSFDKDGKPVWRGAGAAGGGSGGGGTGGGTAGTGTGRESSDSTFASALSGRPVSNWAFSPVGYATRNAVAAVLGGGFAPAETRAIEASREAGRGVGYFAGAGVAKIATGDAAASHAIGTEVGNAVAAAIEKVLGPRAAAASSAMESTGAMLDRYADVGLADMLTDDDIRQTYEGQRRVAMNRLKARQRLGTITGDPTAGLVDTGDIPGIQNVDQIAKEAQDAAGRARFGEAYNAYERTRLENEARARGQRANGQGSAGVPQGR